MAESFSASLKSCGVVVGDVIEIVNKCDSVDASIVRALQEQETAISGWLVEVTAFGEECILGYSLEGRPLEASEPPCRNYGSLRWWRDGGLRERHFHRPFKFRKVGSRSSDGYTWLFPDEMNVYTRCQESK